MSLEPMSAADFQAQQAGVLRNQRKLELALSRISVYGTLQLTVAEAQCLALREQGLRSKNIAQRLLIAEKTVESHFHNAQSRNGCDTSFQLLALFVRAQLGRTER